MPYRSRSGLERATRDADMVLTDLTHQAKWTREEGIELIFVEGEEVLRTGPRGKNGVREDVIRQLARHETSISTDGIEAECT